LDKRRKIVEYHKGRTMGAGMSRLIQVTFVVGLGLLASACDKCGDWNLNTPKFCSSVNPKG
jgi:hypothetical protein